MNYAVRFSVRSAKVNVGILTYFKKVLANTTENSLNYIKAQARLTQSRQAVVVRYCPNQGELIN